MVDVSPVAFVCYHLHLCADHITYGQPVVRRVLLPGGVQDSTGTAFPQEARTRQRADVQLSADMQPDNNLEGDRTAGARQAAATPALISNFSRLQSAYRRGHSTETALLHVMNTVYTAADAKKITALVCLDISVAFDTVDHDVLASHLESQFGVVGVAGAAPSWLWSYLYGRQQFVRLGRHSSPMTQCDCGVPQGSVLGPLLFTAYMSAVDELIESYGVSYHQFADDTQLLISMDSPKCHAGHRQARSLLSRSSPLVPAERPPTQC